MYTIVFFVVCRQEDVEDMRERMRTESGLIVVGSADDYLRVNKKTKCTEGITQGAVDRFIVVSGTKLLKCYNTNCYRFLQFIFFWFLKETRYKS